MDTFLQDFRHLKIQLEEIKSATDTFDNNNFIGEGGFGKVYKGEISHSKGQSMVAFKRLDRSHGQGDPEFLKEILMLSGYTHENLISLLGFCDEDGEKIIVYEHAANGSLDRHLSSTTLTWRQRLKICLGAATGLCYLHHPKETQERVIHRDIKSSNILLDENWNAKVSDMGLSKIGPTNQQRTFLLVTNVVGTLGYIDPMYMETSILTEESDVYSFGVVLFEVLCGRVCYENNNGSFHSLVRLWKKSYKDKKLDEIIFQGLKQNMDQRSLATFSDIAYRCLQKYRGERPKMCHVVEKLENALRFQEIFEDVEQKWLYYEEISKAASPRLVYRSEEHLKILLSKGIFLHRGKTWFCLDKDGEHCEMISAAECLIPIRIVSSSYYKQQKKSRIAVKSRFAVNYNIPYSRQFKTHVKTQFLSSHVTYTLNLVFHSDHYTSNDYLGLNYILAGETKSSTVYLANKREDGWLMAELYQFNSDSRNVDFEITFQSNDRLLVEGIEFLPVERVDHQVLGDEDEDIQTNTYSEQKLSWEYGQINKSGDVWFSRAKNRDTCYMLSAKVALLKEEWRWRSLPESRFEEVAFDPHGSFWIFFSTDRLSSATTYATYLVYKLEENHFGFEPPLKVKSGDYLVGRKDSWFIYLLWPQIPIIRPKVYQSTHNPMNRPQTTYLPQQRDDGWMEVKVWEFRVPFTTDNYSQSPFTTNSNSKNLRLTLHSENSLKGLIVQGIEFRPTHEGVGYPGYDTECSYDSE
ncbi:uncharacterized protein LOC111891875 isoform X1 [Lactuca sativa]|uniref:uncharacterized protein LOC111891875 isoform X1 n=1 Tax=Lactuca sativa TaxID=4236 RepID=UPI000CD97F30|nr:uncharacterized protein LOC111891875 isoform X1 [Lactuca sativa]